MLVFESKCPQPIAGYLSTYGCYEKNFIFFDPYSVEPVFSCHFYWVQGVKFLFFPIFWPASYFLLFFFHEIPSFSYFLGFYWVHRNILKYLK